MQEIGRSSIFLSAISNRLAATSIRARFLGMTVGTAISELIEQPGKGMKFDLEEMESDEATWYLKLIRTKDSLGSLNALRSPGDSIPGTQKPAAKTPKTQAQVQSNQPRSKIVAIEEIEDSENEEDGEDEDLIPYEKPDDDLSDDDDDPTLVQRNKPTPPV